jgi:hypothetical protein
MAAGGAFEKRRSTVEWTVRSEGGTCRARVDSQLCKPQLPILSYPLQVLVKLGLLSTAVLGRLREMGGYEHRAIRKTRHN